MALNDDILQDFFNPPATKFPQLSLKNNLNAAENNKIKRFRVFDEPPEEEKHDLNLGQSQDKLKTNLGQTQDKVRTNKNQDQANLGQSQDKVRTELRTQPKTNLGQTQDKVRTKTAFCSLVGLQRAIALFMYETCHAARDKKTPPLSIENIALYCKTTKKSVQKTIQRLEKKLIITRCEYKNGRGGWTQYELPEHIFQEILHNEVNDKLRTNLGQSQDKPKSQPKTQPRTDTPSSSSNYINSKTTTTSDDGKNSKDQLVFEEWQNLDIEPLNEFGFTKTHLSQIATQSKLTVQIVQDSIYAFAFDLRENDKAKSIKGDTINFFMGILRNGNPYTPPSNYESPKDKSMRIYLERMREIEKKRVEAEKEVFSLEFNNWFRSLSNEQKLNLLPEAFRRSSTSLENNKILESSARNHFEKEIWLKVKEEINTKE